MEQMKKLARCVRGLPFQGAALLRAMRGARSEFGIAAGYQHRREPSYFDDTGLEDEWQREVYEFAARFMAENDFGTVYDVGCGSGFKLMKYLSQHRTVGFDLPETVAFLTRTYPDREWRAEGFDARGIPPADLVVCSDVIEHVPDPDALLAFLESLTTRWLVISTPVRDLLYAVGTRPRFGPPTNPTHLREWSFAEFGRYIGTRFDVARHEVTNRRQATQMILCAKRQPAS